jgi:hypothetical protein
MAELQALKQWHGLLERFPQKGNLDMHIQVYYTSFFIAVMRGIEYFSSAIWFWVLFTMSISVSLVLKLHKLLAVFYGGSNGTVDLILNTYNTSWRGA